jgi:hypothetical protein
MRSKHARDLSIHLFLLLSNLPLLNRTQSLVRRLIRIVIETMAMPTLCMTMTAVMGLYYVSITACLFF